MLALAGAGLLASQSHAASSDSAEKAVIEFTGTGITLCGLRKDPICRARVNLVDGQKTDFLSSSVSVSPGRHVLRLLCMTKFGAFKNLGAAWVEKAVTLAPNGKYSVQGMIVGETCVPDLIDDGTRQAVVAESFEVQASPSGTYPASEAITLHASTDTVSAWTEIPAGDYLIPASHIYVGGRGTGTAGGVLFGLGGNLVVMQSDSSGNAKKVADVEDDLRLTFSRTLSNALKDQAGSRANPARYVESDDSKAAQLNLLPSARLAVSDDAMATLVFRLTVRIHDLPGGKESTKNFFYSVGKRLPVAGPGSWSENHAQAVLDAAAIGMSKLCAALLDDIEGVPTLIDPNGITPDAAFRQR